MTKSSDDYDLTDLADGASVSPETEEWLAAHSDEATEVMIARRVRMLMGELRAASIEVPVDFEARLMARVHQDTTLLSLLDLGLSGMGRALLELLDAFFAVLPTPRAAVL